MKFKYSFCYVLYSPRASIWSSFYCSMTIVSIFRGGDFGNLAGWYSYFFGTIIRHTRVTFQENESLPSLGCIWSFTKSLITMEIQISVEAYAYFQISVGLRLLYFQNFAMFVLAWLDSALRLRFLFYLSLKNG